MCCSLVWWAEDTMPEESRAIQFAQQVAEYVVLQRRTDGSGSSVCRFRNHPCVRKISEKRLVDNTASFVAISIIFDDGMRVVVRICKSLRSISQCYIFARPHAFEHGEWVELHESDSLCCFVSAPELRQFCETLREKSRRNENVTVSATGR